MLELLGLFLWSAFWFALGMVINHHMMNRERRKQNTWVATNRRNRKWLV